MTGRTDIKYVQQIHPIWVRVAIPAFWYYILMSGKYKTNLSTN